MNKLERREFSLKNFSFNNKLNYINAVVLFALVPFFYTFCLFNNYDLRRNVYALCVTIIPVLFLSLWFLRCKHNWAIFILFPLGMYFFQFSYSFFAFFYYLFTGTVILLKDEFVSYHFYFIPLSSLICFFLYKLRKKITSLCLLDLFFKEDLKNMYKMICLKNTSIDWEKESLRAKLIEENQKFSLNDYVLSWIPFLLLFSVPLSYCYVLIPNTYEKISIGNYSFYLSKLRYLVFYFLDKSNQVMFLLIWFFSSKGWCRFFIFCPLSMYLFQIMNLLGEGVMSDDKRYFFLIVILLIYPLYKFRDYFFWEFSYKKWIINNKYMGKNNLHDVKNYAFSKISAYTYQLFWLVLILSFFIHDFFSPSDAISCFLHILYDSNKNLIYPEVFLTGKILLVILFFVLLFRSNGIERILFIVPFYFYSIHLVKLIVEESNYSTQFHRNELWYLIPMGFVGLVYLYKNRKYIYMKSFSEEFEKGFYLKEIERVRMLERKKKNISS